MDGIFFFLATNIALGAALAMDAFSVSVADAIRESKMSGKRMCAIASVYAFFQFAMPMTGYALVRTLITIFHAASHFVPWIAFVLLAFLGGKMILESFSKKETEKVRGKKRTLFLQGIATSIDALSAGFTLAEYTALKAFSAALAICITGLCIGKKAGERISLRADIVGGAILIAIGAEIFCKNIFS